MSKRKSGCKNKGKKLVAFVTVSIVKKEKVRIFLDYT
jgi:hypothetical protein